MVGSNGTMIAIRLVRSKLRKREEHNNSIHPADVVQTTTAGSAATSPSSQQSSTPPQALQLQADTLTYQGQFLWPPPVQPYLYNNDQVGSSQISFCSLLRNGGCWCRRHRCVLFNFRRVNAWACHLITVSCAQFRIGNHTFQIKQFKWDLSKTLLFNCRLTLYIIYQRRGQVLPTVFVKTLVGDGVV